MDSATGEASPASATNGLKKVFTRQNRSKTALSEFDGSTSGRSAAPSIESNNEKLRSSTSGGNNDAPPTGISKLIPGSRRRRKKKLETEGSMSQDNGSGELQQHHSNESEQHVPNNGIRSNSTLDTANYGSSNGSESPMHLSIDTSNHQQFSSPLIITTQPPTASPDNESAPSERSATNSETASDNSRSISRAATTGDLSRERSSRKLKDAFSPKPSPSPSPDRETTPKSPAAKRGLFGSRRRSSSSAKRTPNPSEDIPPLPSAIPPHVALSNASQAPSKPPPLDIPPTPATPPPGGLLRPVTTVTPPTPTDVRSRSPVLPSANIAEITDQAGIISNLPANVVVSPSGNMISHRRVRSASAAHNPSKLSNAMSAPLTPTVEETKTAVGFFSSMFSAAQNAASSLGSTLNNQNRSRANTDAKESEEPADGDRAGEKSTDSSQDDETNEKKELAVETLGMGELNFSDLGIDATMGGVITTKDGVVFTKTEAADRPRRPTASQRDELSAKIEDMRAARAVSMAYEKPTGGGTGPQPAPEPTTTDTRPSTQFSGLGRDSTGEHTPPGGSIFEGETGAGIRRSGSVRSRLASRRHRGSSGATIGALGAAGLGLGLSGGNSSVPRLTGFAVASKKRNRDFHQLFRSVPEDDYLIEDYSCALQREIILAGRIYISEGHICFSSNILGWVTTLVISFDEIMAVEKESTAMVFPNAIAIQTLHARHTFRSLLSREATYDLMVNIWKINHPTLRSSVNGTRIEQGTGDKTEKAEESDAGSEVISDEEDEVYDEDEEDEAGATFVDAGEGSVASSDKSDSIQRLSRKASTLPLSAMAASSSTPALANKPEAKATEKGASASSPFGQFPGPPTHLPTEFTDPSGHYERVLKDEIIPAPLGRVFTLVFGPASGAFMTRFLLDDQKVTELQFEDDKKGLSMENKTRSYTYIKPLHGSIGPRQTRCNSTENLDFLDLEKAVLVTLNTQTPDVPSGNVFSVKTKYLFTWAENNATRFYMTCTIEWTGKSWLKGPIEKGANDGQLSFGTDLIKALRAGVSPRSRSATLLKGAGKGGKGKRKGANAAELEAAASAKAALEAAKRQAESWGMLEPLRGPLSPVISVLKPLWSGNVAVGIIAMLLVTIWFRAPPQSRLAPSGVGSPLLSVPERIIAYEELWQREESELWNWLEERVGMDGLAYPVADTIPSGNLNAEKRRQKQQFKGEREFEGRLRDEKMTEREIEDAIRVTQQRLDILNQVVKKQKHERQDTTRRGSQETA